MKQLNNIDEELAAIKNLGDYTIVAMLHHHLFPITRDDFLKQKWREKIFVGKIMDSSKALVDSRDLVEWLRKHQIQYVLHGHKHLPFLAVKKDVCDCCWFFMWQWSKRIKESIFKL